MRISAAFSPYRWAKAWTYGLIYLFTIGTLFGSDTINNLITLRDYKRALFEIEQQLILHPQDPAWLRLKIFVYARQKNIPSMLEAWKKLQKSDSTDSVLEEMSLAILGFAFDSPSLQVRGEAAVAAFMANTARTLPLCLQALQDKQVDVRRMAAHLAGRMRDVSIQKRLLDMVLHDPSSEVRQEAILALGASRSLPAAPYLKELILDNSRPTGEKFMAVCALADMMSSPDSAFVLSLQSSERSYFRALSCQIVLGEGAKELARGLFPLIDDPSQEVRTFALQCVGLLSPSLICQDKPPRFTDAKTLVLWNWALSCKEVDTHRALQKIKELLQSEDQELRLLAASALCHLGKEGFLLVSECLQESSDPLVRLQFGMYLIWQRKNALFGAAVVAESLKMIEEPISRQQFGVFTFVGAAGSGQELQQKDLMTRLDICSMLATVPEYPVEGLLSSFIGERMGGVTAACLSIMVQEGMITPEMLHNLLEGKDEKLALQAAILLAIYTKDPKTLVLLEEKYALSPRGGKEQIIFAIGSVGARESVSFLATLFDEPFESLRILAASALLRSLS